MTVDVHLFAFIALASLTQTCSELLTCLHDFPKLNAYRPHFVRMTALGRVSVCQV